MRATFDPRIVPAPSSLNTVHSPLLCWQRFEECREKFEAVVRRRSRIFTRGLQSWREEEQADRAEEHSSQEASRKAQQLNLLND